MTKALFAQYLEHEARAVERFKQDRKLQRFKDMPDRMVHFHLLQRLPVSRNFVAWYNLAITRLKLEDHKKILRDIVQEEVGIHHYSGTALTLGSTHFEDLVHDLKLLGISEREILNAGPTPWTTDFIKRLDLLLLIDPADINSDLVILVSLRVAGELLVAAEYDQLVKRYEMIPAKGFRFFPQHAQHDSSSHPDAFAEAIERLLMDEIALSAAAQAVERATDTRLSFFIPV